MLSLCDLPNEVLANITLTAKDLRAIVLVSHHLYDLYIVKLYEDFDAANRQLWNGHRPWPDRFPAYLTTILTSSRLASCVKEAQIGESWRNQLLDNALHGADYAKYLTLLPKGSTTTRNGSEDHVLDYILFHFPRLETLDLELTKNLNHSVIQLARCTQLKHVSFSQDWETPNLKVIAAILKLPQITSLSFVCEEQVDITPLASLRPRTSSLESLVIRQPPTPGCPDKGIDFPLFLSALFGTLKALKHFRWERWDDQLCDTYQSEACATYHNAWLQPALAPFAGCLETFQIWMAGSEMDLNPGRCLSQKKDLLPSFRGFTSLKRLELAPETILHEPNLGDRDLSPPPLEICATFSGDRPLGFFADLLPCSLEYLHLHADNVCVYRGGSYWLHLIKDIVNDRKRLSALQVIVIHNSTFYESGVCYQCSGTRMSCGLCSRSTTFNAMIELCQDAKIELKMLRGCDSANFWPGEHEDEEMNNLILGIPRAEWPDIIGELGDDGEDSNM